MCAAPCFFEEKKWWVVDKRDKLWNMFLPCVQDYNNKQKQLISIALLLLDESMITLFPDTKKLGGLPNYTLELRDSFLLGAMLKNGAEFKSKLISRNDTVKNPEQEARKFFDYAKSRFPDGNNKSAHVPVLRQKVGTGFP